MSIIFTKKGFQKKNIFPFYPYVFLFLYHTNNGDKMEIFTYAIIFICKIIENMLATLRLIVIANGKKGLGSFLQFVISIVWIVATGMVIVDIHKDPMKIIAFAFGSWIGSYFGCAIEEKMALGDNMLFVVSKPNKSQQIEKKLKEENYVITTLQSCGEEKKTVLLIMSPRKKRIHIVNFIKKIDRQAMIVAENAIELEAEKGQSTKT